MPDHLHQTAFLSAAPGWLRSLILLLAAVISLPLFAADPGPDIKGRVISVQDGDTLTILTLERKQIKIRLEGIDAPELKQAFGSKAKAMLSALVFDKDVVVITKGKDRYLRTIGRITCGKLDVNLLMVQRGFAWRYPRYSVEPALIEAQAKAQKARRGLWREQTPCPPWDWRP